MEALPPVPLAVQKSEPYLHAASHANFFEDRKHFLDTLRALKAFPIYRGKTRIGMEGPSGRQYRYTALCCLTPSSTLRVFVCFAVEHPMFERTSLLAVVVNCLALAMSPVIHEDALASQELLFTLLFTLEAWCRAAAMGFAGHPYAYLSDNWNRLDFFVVVASWMPLLFPQLDNLTAMRAVRALRPLRTINRLKGMQEQVNTLIDSLPHLVDVALLAAFLLVVYGVLGLQLFGGTLTLRCYNEGSATPLDPLRGVCAVPDASAAAPQQGTCDKGQLCAAYGENPMYGTVGFDDIVTAWMTIFQCTTLEGWVDVLYMTSHHSGGFVAVTYFVSLVVLGAYYIPNLFLAVMWHIYSKNHVQERSQRAVQAEAPGVAVPAAAGVRSREPHVHRLVHRLVTSTAFNVAISTLVFLNVLLMAAEHSPMDAAFRADLERLNVICVVLFAIELEMKHMAFGVAAYWSDTFNCFDGAIVLVSLLDILLAALHLSDGSSVHSQVFRTFRLLRIFRLIRSWTSLQRLLSALIALARQFCYLLLLLALIIFIFALLGMQLFGGVYRPPDFAEPPRTNFDTIGNAMITVFIVAVGEGWNEAWIEAHRAVGGWAFLFFSVVVVVANYMLLNLVVALLISAFEDGNGEVEESFTSGKTPNRRRRNALVLADDDDDDDEDYTAPAIESLPLVLRSDRLPTMLRECLMSIAHNECSLLLFARDNPIRRACGAAIHFRVQGTIISFDNVVISLILLSSVTMGFESCHLEADSALSRALYSIDLVVITAFVVELLTRVIANGLLIAPHAYLRNRWNILDAFITVASVLSLLLSFSHSSSEAIRSLRLLRVLRPLRLISSVEGMRTAVQLLLRAMPRVLDVILVFLLFLLVFSILGVQLFAGRFGSCTAQPSLQERTECERQGFEWQTPAWGHFDHVGASALILFEMTSLEGWPVVMFAGIDASDEIGQAPVRDYAMSQSLFFISWIIIGSLLLTNMLVGVLITTFNDMKRKEEEANRMGIILSEKQRAWVGVVNYLLVVKPRPRPPPPAAAWRAWCHRLVCDPRFETCILGVIVINTLLMALDGHAAAASSAHILIALNDVCTLIFIGEAGVKIVGFGPRAYFTQAWNVFDFGVVLAAVADWLVALLAASLEAQNPTMLRMLRMVRITRILRTLRVVRAARGLKVLLSMLILSLPTLVNIVGLYLVVTSVYALLAMQLFGRVRHGQYINEDANFCDFGTAALTLFRCATGEAWNNIMHEAMLSEGSGECSDEAGDCGTWLAMPFFVSYVILSMYIVIKMMIVLIIDNFALALKRDQNSLSPESADVFIDVWSYYDREATGLMPVRHLVSLLRRLPPPLGLDPHDFPSGAIRTADLTRYAFQLELRPRVDANGESCVHFSELLAHLAKDSYKETANATVASMFRRQRARGSVHVHVRHTLPWEEVLPSAESKIGRELREKLAECDALDRMEDTRASQRPQDGELLEHSVASAVIGRVAKNWQQRRVKPRIQAQLHAQRFVVDARERTRQAKHDASRKGNPTQMV